MDVEKGGGRGVFNFATKVDDGGGEGGLKIGQISGRNLWMAPKQFYISTSKPDLYNVFAYVNFSLTWI